MPRRSAEEIRDRALAGAATCFRERGIADTSVDDIVRESGVARSTLYRHVGDRNDLLLAVTIDEIDQLSAALAQRLDRSASVVDVLVEGVLGVVDLVAASPVLHQLVARPELIADDVSGRGIEVLVARFHEFVGPLFVEHRDSIRPDLDPDVAVELLVRTIASLVAFGVRVPRSGRDRRRYLLQALVPVFVTDEVSATYGRD